MALGDLAVDIVPIVCAVASERSDGACYLLEERSDLRTVIDIMGRQFRRDDRAGIGIRTEMQFPPGASALSRKPGREQGRIG